MNLPDSVGISSKGVDEVKNRTYKLSMRKRSVLILLETPRTMEYLFSKSVLPRPELILEIGTLSQDGFIVLGGPQSMVNTAVGQSPSNGLSLKSGIVVSEAKFLMIDFWVDSFGTEAEEFTQEVGACENFVDLGMCLRKLIDGVQKHCPDRLPLVRHMVQEINQTA